MANKGAGKGHWQGTPKSKWQKRVARLEGRLDALDRAASRGWAVFAGIASLAGGVYQWAIPLTLWLRVVVLLVAGALMWFALLRLSVLAPRKKLALLIAWPFVALGITWWSVMHAPFEPRYSSRQVVEVSNRNGAPIPILTLADVATLAQRGEASISRIRFGLQRGASVAVDTLPRGSGLRDVRFVEFVSGHNYVFERGEPSNSQIVTISTPDGKVERWLDRCGLWANRKFRVTLDRISDKSDSSRQVHLIEYAFRVEER